jgi:hypothetical protein
MDIGKEVEVIEVQPQTIPQTAPVPETVPAQPEKVPA